MFVIYNSTGEEIAKRLTLTQAIKLADKRTKQLCGSFHFVQEEGTDKVSYTTKKR